MLFKTHLVFAFLVFLIVQSVFPASKIVLLVSILFGALIVDIDSKKSKAGRFIGFRVLQFFVSHRGALHSIFTGFLLALIISFVNKIASFGFFLGYMSHLILDSTTKSGAMLFWPLFHVRFRFIIKTGSLLEEIIFIGFIVLDLYFSVVYFL